MPQPYPSDPHTYLLPYLPQPSPPTLTRPSGTFSGSFQSPELTLCFLQSASFGKGWFISLSPHSDWREGEKARVISAAGVMEPVCLCSLKLDKWTAVHVSLGQWPIACSLEFSVTQNCRAGNGGLPPTLLRWEFYAPWI